MCFGGFALDIKIDTKSRTWWPFSGRECSFSKATTLNLSEPGLLHLVRFECFFFRHKMRPKILATKWGRWKPELSRRQLSAQDVGEAVAGRCSPVLQPAWEGGEGEGPGEGKWRVHRVPRSEERAYQEQLLTRGGSRNCPMEIQSLRPGTPRVSAPPAPWAPAGPTEGSTPGATTRRRRVWQRRTYRGPSPREHPKGQV